MPESSVASLGSQFTYCSETVLPASNLPSASGDDSVVGITANVLNCLQEGTRKSVELLSEVSKTISDVNGNVTAKQRFVLTMIEDENVTFPGECDFDALWKDPGAVLRACKTKQASVKAYSFLLSFCQIIGRGTKAETYEKIATLNGGRQMIRAALNHAREVNPNYPKEIRAKIVKGSDLLSTKGMRRFEESYTAVWKTGGSRLAKLMLASLLEYAHHMSAEDILFALGKECLSAEEVVKEAIGKTSRRGKVDATAFPALLAQGQILDYPKDRNGEPKVVDGKVPNVTKRVPREIGISADDGVLTPAESNEIKKWIEIHRYTVSDQECLKLKEKVGNDLPALVKLWNAVAEASIEVLAVEKQIDACLTRRRMKVLGAADWQSESNKKDVDKKVLFATRWQAVKDEFADDGLLKILEGKYRRRLEMLDAYLRF